jgi:hypothetical protein
MRHTAAIVATAAAVILNATLLAQAPPSFAGKWTLVADPNPAAGGGRGGAGMGQETAIEQDATSITITRTSQMGEFKTTHKLDGSESKNTLSFGGNSIDQLSKAKWDGGKLTITTSMNFNGTPVETVMALSLDPSGNLVIETTRPDMQGGGQPITTKATYKKS